jgi:hypothetical protein
VDGDGWWASDSKGCKFEFSFEVFVLNLSQILNLTLTIQS